jgi:predicted permease
VFLPDIDKDVFTALILLNAVPSAVASYIISARYKVAEDFVSSMLVLSTAVSIITIPVWLYFIL